MGIYGDWAEKYFESGIYTVPCGINKDKAPVFLNWTDYCETAPNETTFQGWVNKYKDANQIGLLLGKSTGKVAFDFDYAYDSKKCKISEEEFKRDRARVEKEIMELLPDSPCGKVGAKGWTRIYKWNPSLVNKSLDRNGVRLFDFLSQGKQTIIPPSIHSTKADGKKIIYQWIDSPLEDCDELPELPMSIIESIIELYSQDRPGRPSIELMSRHARIMYYIYDILKVDSDLDRVAKFAIAYDKKMNSGKFSSKDKPYLSDKGHHKTSDENVNARVFVEKINKWAIKKELLQTKEEKKENGPIGSSTWDHFFEISFNKVRKDIFSEETFVKKEDSGLWTPIVNYEEVLKSYARQKKIPKTHVPEELSRWRYENKNLEFLCDLPNWDGTDYVGMIAKNMKSSKFSEDEVVQIFKHWGVTMFRRLYDPNIQNRCIIPQGKQGAGKDTLIKAIFGAFKPYYEETSLTGTPKDVLEIVSRLLIVHIEEFDQTKNLDVGFLKSLITQPSSFFRESYGRSPNSKPMKASFISSVNVSDFFRDPTGNRRFIVIPIETINWDYPKDKSPQAMAQLMELFKRGEHYTLSPDLEEKIKDVLVKLTPESLETSIIETYVDRMKALVMNDDFSPYKGRNFITGVEAIPLLTQISKDFSCGIRRVQNVLKIADYSRRDAHGVKYFLTPK